VLGHSVADTAQVAADVREVRAGAQQVRGKRVACLVGDRRAEVEQVDPLLEVAGEK
jgi:lipid A disaccharide synthetase